MAKFDSVRHYRPHQSSSTSMLSRLVQRSKAPSRRSPGADACLNQSMSCLHANLRYYSGDDVHQCHVLVLEYKP